MAQTTSPRVPAAVSLGQAVDAAWQRAVTAQESRGREQIALARQTAASAWTPHAPAVEVSQRQGRSGVSETELGVFAPISTPGRRSALAAAAAADLELAQAGRRASRWRLAGEVREAAWSLETHRADLAAAREQVRLLQQLAADVDRRVQAGDLARADSLVARAEVLGAEGSMAELQQRVTSAKSRWRTLTGLDSLADPTEATMRAIEQEHPELALARLEVQRTRAQLDAVRQSRRDPPEVGLNWRQERSSDVQGRQNSVGVILRVPFGTDARSGPAEAAAVSELDLVRLQEERLRERHAADVRTAREALESTEQQVLKEQARLALLRERAQLLDKSFHAGETPLPDLLRAVGSAAQAEGALARQQSAVGAARARLNQALGVTP
jgi:cobalt-zinc-cadmium efflux system outer membrane protein